MCSKSCSMRIWYQMQKTSGEVLVSDTLIDFLNPKTLKPAWKSFTIAGWPGGSCESMELFPKIVGLNITENIGDIGYSRLSLEIASASILGDILSGEIPKKRLSSRTTQVYCSCPFWASPAVCFPSTLQCTHTCGDEVPLNASQIFRLHLGSRKKMWDVSINFPEVWCLMLFPQNWGITSGCLAESSFYHSFRSFSQ